MGARNDDISLKLAKAVDSGFLPDVLDHEVNYLTQRANAIFGDDVLMPPRALYNPQGLRRWAGSLAIARNGGFATALLAGDSTVFGAGADNTQTTTDATGAGFTSADQLRKRFHTFLGQSLESGIGIMPSDSRVVRTSAVSSTTTGAFGTTSYRLEGAGSQLAFPAQNATTIDIISVWIPGTSNPLVYSIDGGADVISSSNPGGTANSIVVDTVSGLSAASHSITIKAPATGRTYIVGVIYRTATGVVVPRVGKPGATSLDFAVGSPGTVTTAGQFRRQYALSAINAWAPDVLILKLGINDFGGSVPVSEFKTNLKQIALYQTDPITAANLEFNGANPMLPRKTVGGSVLLVMGPRAASMGVYSETSYWQAAREICDEMDHVSMINLADWYGSFAEAHDPAMDLQIAGSVHSKPKGYARDADIIFSALTSNQILGVS